MAANQPNKSAVVVGGREGRQERRIRRDCDSKDNNLVPPSSGWKGEHCHSWEGEEHVLRGSVSVADGCMQEESPAWWIHHHSFVHSVQQAGIACFIWYLETKQLDVRLNTWCQQSNIWTKFCYKPGVLTPIPLVCLCLCHVGASWLEGCWCFGTGSRDWPLHAKHMLSYWLVFASRWFCHSRLVFDEMSYPFDLKQRHTLTSSLCVYTLSPQPGDTSTHVTLS